MIPLILKRPAAMIPHKSRAFRCILDLSFLLKLLGQHYKSVNETTNKQASQESMAQLGSALKRIIAQVADNQHAQKPVLFAKLDIKDGFWRLVVSDDDAWNFCYCLPNEDPNAQLDETKMYPIASKWGGANLHRSFAQRQKRQGMSSPPF
jgi:hypothetical protein